ncbi:fatty acid-binding protein DegV [Enterococcus sp. JM4C]|uniref:DegV family protein n=1 Tax=Candidatus Enterococcus huntleyi TaxID=1857217 RepID=UPI001379A651|nr:DegV family protein [Enterococcus sp. JM4C]KAF1295109.1 fatty acid-binding protein DegV [Enterococcus sp. JM4C]
MYQIITDSCCDLPYEVLEEHNIVFIPMFITLDGNEYVDDLGKTFDQESFLEKIQNGGLPSTSQINVGRYLEYFKGYVDKKIPLLYVAFSSGMSGSYESACQAVEMLKEEYDDPSIYVVDTQAASLGEGVLVLEAARLQKEGRSIEETVSWLEENKSKVHSWVTVNDLKHLERGGRISKTAAALGGLLNVKPIINVSPEGKLENVDKVRGRNRALKTVVDETMRTIVAPLTQTIYIAYAGDQEAAEKVKQQLLETKNVGGVICYPLGPTIASHTGYGCIAVFSMGITREK